MVPNRSHNREWWIPYAVILPALLLIVVFKLYPIANTVYQSFIRKGAYTLRNYELVFTDSIFGKSLWVTFKFNIIITPVQILISIAMALLVNQRIKGIATYRSIYYLPVTISMPVRAVEPDAEPATGVVNSVLNAVGIGAQALHGGDRHSIPSWPWLPGRAAGIDDVILAGLQGISPDL